VCDDGPSNRTNRANQHSCKHTSNWAKVDLVFTERWVKSVVEEWDTKNDYERVEIADHIVRYTVGC
jgi:hypothetical protein